MTDYLNNKIFEILKQHEGGREFFDNLDHMIRMDYQVIDLFLDFIKKSSPNYPDNYTYGTKCVVYLTGEFGKILFNNKQRHSAFAGHEFRWVEGGLRNGDKTIELPEPYEPEYSIFVDDSIYSYNTAKTIEKAIGKEFDDIYVVYDGSKQIRRNTKSLFRYYEKRTTQTTT